jgi:hypothetical protein
LAYRNAIRLAENSAKRTQKLGFKKVLDPEVQALRQDLLNTLSSSLLDIGKQMDPAQQKPFRKGLILTSLGDLLLELGHSGQALEHYEKALQSLQAACDNPPDNSTYDIAWADRALMEDKIGNVLSLRGDAMAPTHISSKHWSCKGMRPPIRAVSITSPKITCGWFPGTAIAWGRAVCG